MKLNDTQKTALWAAVAVATVGLVALVYWIITSRRKYNGLVVIGNAAPASTTTTSNTTNTMTTTSTTNTGTAAQAQFNNTSLPRGYRNNNPLNIRKNASNAWKGKVVPGSDPAFEQFITMAYGYRAGLYLLRKYIGQGHNTIRKIINKWAPPSENNTSSYVNNVVARTGIGADVVISRTDMDKLCKIAWAMAWSENGRAPASMEDIYQGWALL